MLTKPPTARNVQINFFALSPGPTIFVRHKSRLVHFTVSFMEQYSQVSEMVKLWVHSSDIGEYTVPVPL